MEWKSHVALGIILSAAIFYFVFTVRDPSLAWLVSLSALSALIPDLDHEMSKGKRLLDLIVILFAAIVALGTQSWILFFAIVGLYFILYKLLKPKHRGITHTLAACLVFSALVYVFAGTMPAAAVFIGYFSHLVADRF